MPKLHVEIEESGHKLFDVGEPLKDDSVQVTSTQNAIEIRVPLASLGSPQRVLLGLRVQTGEVPLESEPWRVLDPTGSVDEHSTPYHRAAAWRQSISSAASPSS